MDHQPLFSIIIPTYNREDMISHAVSSIVDQEYDDWEVVVIDDGSTDNTMEVVRGFGDRRIRYVYIPRSERSAARNRGIKESCGRYCCFLDSDDYFLPNHLAVLAGRANPKGDRLLKTGFCVESLDGSRRHSEAWETGNPVMDVWTQLPGLLAYAIPRDIALLHQFPAQFSFWEDRHFLLRLFLQHPVERIPFMTAVLREHPDRSVNLQSADVLEKRIEHTVGAVEDLFQKHGSQLEQWITPRMKRRKLANMLIGIATDARQAGMKNAALDALAVARPYLDRRTLPIWLKEASGALRIN